MKTLVLCLLLSALALAQVPDAVGCIDIFPQVQTTANQYGITVLPVDGAPAMSCAIPFPNVNFGGWFVFVMGIVHDPVSDLNLPADWFIESAVNSVELRLADYLYLTHRGPPLDPYERFHLIADKMAQRQLRRELDRPVRPER